VILAKCKQVKHINVDLTGLALTGLAWRLLATQPIVRSRRAKP
jgi:hypothetical protein